MTSNGAVPNPFLGIRNCKACSLAGKFGRCVPPSIDRPIREIKILAIGEGPGYEESKIGRPFVGAAGREFDRMLNRAGLSRDQVAVTNIVKMRPSLNDDDPPPEAISICTERWLKKELAIINPKLVIAIGSVAVKWFFPDVSGVIQAHRLPREASIPGVWEGIVFPVFHTAAALHQPNLIKEVRDDFTALGEFLKGKLPVHNPKPPNTSDYWECRDTEWLADRIMEAGCVSLDTESDENGFWCLSVSTRDGEGIVVRKTSPLGPLKEVLESGKVMVVMQNAYYDLKVLRQVGIRIPRGCIFDAMISGWLLGEQSRGLKEMSYRRLGIAMTRYEELVGHYGQGRAMEYLEKAAELGYPDVPEEEALEWDAKKGEPVRKWHKGRPVAARVKLLLADVEKKGVDPFERWKGWSAWLRGAVEEGMGRKFPTPGISDVPNLQDAINYAAADADMTRRLKYVLEAEMQKWGLSHIFWSMEMPLVPDLVGMTEEGIKVDLDYLRVLQVEFQGRIDAILQKTWGEAGCEFNPGSPKQTAWVLKNRGIRLGRVSKKTGEASTSDKALERYAKDPVVAGILEYRRLVKLKGTYVDSYLETADGDGRVHTQWRQTGTVTGRLSSAEENLQNVPKGGEGLRIRDAFVARDADWVLFAVDYSQLEMKVMAWDSGCQSMIQAFQNGDDIHGKTMLDMWGITKDNTSPGEYSDKRTLAKNLNFGIIYGVTPIGFHVQNRNISVPDSKKYIEAWFAARPEVAQRMDERRRQVYRDGYVTDGWGRVRWVPGIYSDVDEVRERSVRETINSPIQGYAAGLIKKAMVSISKRLGPEGFRAKMLLQVHDELVFECPRDEVRRLFELVKREMESAADIGVPLTVNAKSGDRWGSLVELGAE